ncbi:2590_t:CDS:2, partial [Gigaspora margarita]
KTAYYDLIQILLHSQFDKTHLITNLQTLKKYREKLPLMQIQSHKVPINTRNTPSTTKNFTKVYYFSLIEYLQRILKNPIISSYLYFGPGILSESCEELWEGNLWAESPLFGQSNITTSRGSFKCGDFVQYLSCEILQYGRIQSFVIKDNLMKVQIQRLLPYSRIPQNLYSLERELQAQEWFLVEETSDHIIEPSFLIKKIEVWFKDQLPPPFFDLSVNEVLYYFNGSWKCRPIKFRNRHPSEYISTNSPPNSTMPVLKFFLDLYYDDFGTFRNVYHSLGGVYLQIGNMPHKLRKQLRNHFVIGFVPFGGSIQDFIKPFIEEVKKLEQGFVINLNEVDYWVTGGLGVFTSDLPQGNDIAGTLRHNAYRGCRICKATKDQFTNLSFDIYYHARYHQVTDQEFQVINQQTSKTAKSRLCSQYGLRLLPGPLDSILHDRHLH